MLVFPQLQTGAAALFPLTKQTNLRTVVNRMADGRTVVYADADAGVREWELRANGLTLAEWIAIDGLFQAALGSLHTFTFLDPAGNLIAESENFAATAWSSGPLIQLTAGIQDPFGSTRATRVVNAGQAVQALGQTLPAPGNFQYAFSVWARTTGGSGMTMLASAGAASASRAVALTAQWRRVQWPVALGQSTDTVTFSVELEPGATADLFGFQVEPQPGASDYKRTGLEGGVFGKARFASDELTARAQGTDVFDAVIRIVSAWS